MKLNTESRIYIFVFLLALISSLSFYNNDFSISSNYNIDDIGNCETHKGNINEISNLGSYKKKLNNFEISLFPDFENIKCLGKIQSYEYQNENLDPFTGKPTINFFIYTSTNFKILIFAFLNTSYLIFLFKFRKINLLSNYLIILFFNYLVSYFFEFNFLISNFLINLIPVFVISTVLLRNNILKSKFLIFSKKNLIIILNLLYLPLYIKLIRLEFPLDYYLINYNNGYVRRGFLGSLIFNLSSFNLNIGLFLLVALLIFCYVYIIYETVNLIFEIKNYLAIFFFISPIFLVYPLNQVYRFQSDFANPEILGICLLFYFFRLYKNKNRFYIFFIFYAAALFTHELNLFILPFILIFLYFENDYKNYIVFTLILISLLFLFSYLMIPFSESVINNICDDIKDLQIRDNICENAIANLKLSYLTSDPLEILMRNFSFNIFTATHISPLSYLISMVFGWGLLLYFRLVKNEQIIYLALFFVFIPVMLFSTDWGRVLYLYFSCLYIVVFQKHQFTKLRIDNNYKINFNLILAVTIFATIWYSRSCCSNEMLKFSNLITTNSFLYFLFFSQLKKVTKSLNL